MCRRRCVELGLAADGDVGACRDVLEELVDGPAQRVGHDERADDEPHAHDDRERGHDEAGLVGPDVAKGEPEHHQSPNRFMRSSTRSVVVRSISSAMRPSARKTMRSLYPRPAGRG